MNMNYSGNATYFKPKRLLSYIGGVIALVGLPVFFITEGMVVAALPFVVVGAILIVINREINVKDSEVEEQIKRELDRLAQELEDHYYDVKRPFPKMMITTVGDYVTEGEGLKIRKSSLGKYITSEYHVALFGFKGGRLYLSEEKFCTVQERVEAKFSDFDFLELSRMEYGKVEGAAIPHATLALYHTDGRVLVSVPAPDDFTTEKFASDTNDILKKHRDDAAAKEKPSL